MVRLMVNYPISFVSKLPSKLLLAAFFLCLGACAGVTQKPYADVFALIQKLQTMHPLTIEKLQNEGFVVTSQQCNGLVYFEGTGPDLADGTQIRSFNFRISFENTSKTFLVVDINNICITREDIEKKYHISKTSLFVLPDGIHRIHYVAGKEARIGFSSLAEKAACMEGFNIDTYPYF